MATRVNAFFLRINPEQTRAPSVSPSPKSCMSPVIFQRLFCEERVPTPTKYRDRFFEELKKHEELGPFFAGRFPTEIASAFLTSEFYKDKLTSSFTLCENREELKARILEKAEAGESTQFFIVRLPLIPGSGKGLHFSTVYMEKKKDGVEGYNFLVSDSMGEGDFSQSLTSAIYNSSLKDKTIYFLTSQRQRDGYSCFAFCMNDILKISKLIRGGSDLFQELREGMNTSRGNSGFVYVDYMPPEMMMIDQSVSELEDYEKFMREKFKCDEFMQRRLDHMVFKYSSRKRILGQDNSWINAYVGELLCKYVEIGFKRLHPQGIVT